MADNKNDFISTERLYLTADDKVVGDKDPKKHKLLVIEGGRLPYEEALKYGLIKEVSEGDDNAEVPEREPIVEVDGVGEGDSVKKAPEKAKAKPVARKK